MGFFQNQVSQDYLQQMQPQHMPTNQHKLQLEQATAKQAQSFQIPQASEAP
jgi:hypothetical protein